MFVKINGIDGDVQHINRNHVISISEFSQETSRKGADANIAKIMHHPLIPEEQKGVEVEKVEAEFKRFENAKGMVTTAEGSFATVDSVDELLERFTAV